MERSDSTLVNPDKTMESCSDSELVIRFKHGEEYSFDILVKRYQSRIYMLAQRMVRNQEDAWELAQETFIRAYKALRKFKEKSSFYTWIYRICINLCLTFLKKSKKDKMVSSLDTMNEETLMLESAVIQKEKNEPETVRTRREISVAISDALNQLPTQQRIVFMMRQYDELNNDEIAEHLNLSLGGVKSNYHHAVKKLQEILKEWI